MPLNLNIKPFNDGTLSQRAIIEGFGLRGLVPFPYTAGVEQQYRSSGQERAPGVERAYTTGPQQEVQRAHITGEGADANLVSWFGLPVFADVRFKDVQGEIKVRLDTVLVEVSQKRNIITSAVQGRDGTVKEYISDGDYDIRLRGALVARDAQAYPHVAVRDLHEILLRKSQIEIISDYLRLFNVYSIVVLEYQFVQQEGFQNVQLFEITAVSDTPEELIFEGE